MPDLGLDLNLPPELQDVCRRLSYGRANSPSSSRTPPLPLIYGSPEELMTPISPRTTSALYPAPGETSTPTVRVPMDTALALRPPAQPQSQQAQEAATARRMSEQRRHKEERASFAEYQHQRLVAGLQQALWSQQQSQQLMLYTVDGRAASYETKWDELHPVSQMLLLQIEYGPSAFLPAVLLLQLETREIGDRDVSLFVSIWRIGNAVCCCGQNCGLLGGTLCALDFFSTVNGGHIVIF